MNTDLVAQSGRNRLIATLTLLAVLLAVVTAGPRLGVGAGLFALPEQDERWALVGDELPPAKVERVMGGFGEKSPSGPASSAPPLGALAREAIALLQPPAILALHPARLVSAQGDSAHRRPDPTGPPLFG